MNFLKSIESYLPKSEDEPNDENDVMSDTRYICQSCSLINSALQKGDVMQMPNGDIITSEVKTLTFHYTWDSKKGKFVRVQSGGRSKKHKVNGEKEYNVEDLADEDSIDELEQAF